MPLGWHVTVYRQQNDGTTPANFETPQGAEIAVWQTHAWGLRWLDDLVAQQKAIDLGGNGYPMKYTALAQHIIPQLRERPPEADEIWTIDPGDVLLPGWLGKTTKDPSTMDACQPNEWLIIEAWDRS
jgi:hypothetical protein